MVKVGCYSLNVMFFDGSNEGMESTIKQMQALKTLDQRTVAAANAAH
jgi:hypothetical protein